MSNKVLLDNWQLRDTGIFLSGKNDFGTTSELIIKDEPQNHEWNKISAVGTQVECLFHFLTEIVLRDKIVIDTSFALNWEETPVWDFFHQNPELFESKEFKSDEPFLAYKRSEIVKNLCFTPSMIKVQGLNEQLYAEGKKSYDPFFSQTIWGGAGLLARGEILGVPYSGHPIRQRAFKNTLFRERKRDATQKVLQFIEDERSKIFTASYGENVINEFSLNLSPVVIAIIENSKAPDDLLKSAMSLRSEYSGLRSKISEYQEYLDNDSPKGLLKMESMFASIRDHVKASQTDQPYGKTNVSHWISWLPISIPGPKAIKQKMGVRAKINRLIFTAKARKSIEKFYRMFEIKNTPLEKEVESYFQQKL